MTEDRMTQQLEIALDADSLGYYWQHPTTGQWFGPYNIAVEKLASQIIEPTLGDCGLAVLSRVS